MTAPQEMGRNKQRKREMINISHERDAKTKIRIYKSKKYLGIILKNLQTLLTI